MLKPASKSEEKNLVKFEVWKAYMVAIMVNCCTLERGVWHTTTYITPHLTTIFAADPLQNKTAIRTRVPCAPENPLFPPDAAPPMQPS